MHKWNGTDIASGGVMSTKYLYCEVIIVGFATKRHGWKEDLMAASIHVSRETQPV